MSRKFSIAIVLLAFAAGLMINGPTSYALQTAPAAQEHGAMGGSGMGPMTPEDRLKMLTEKLNLTEDQQAKLKPIIEDQAKQMKALHESSIDKMTAILTPEQQTKWKELRQEMMAKHKDHGQMDHQ